MYTVGHKKSQIIFVCNFVNITVRFYKDQLLLAKPHDALHHDKWQNVKQSHDHNHPHLGCDMSSF